MDEVQLKLQNDENLSPIVSKSGLSALVLQHQSLHPHTLAESDDTENQVSVFAEHQKQIPSNNQRCTVGFSKNKTALMIAGVLTLGLASIHHVYTNRPLAPTYRGKRLDQWAKEHPSKYYTAVGELGTNALPYLLNELAATDSHLASSAQSLLGKVISVGDIFVSSRHRRYYARLGFQVLDTNAVPALMEALFAKPIVRSASDLGINSAWALSCIDSPAANVLKTDRLTTALFDTDIQVQRNAILAWTMWASRPTLVVSQRIETYLAGTNMLLKTAALDTFCAAQGQSAAGLSKTKSENA